jgi:hypothetical protein
MMPGNKLKEHVGKNEKTKVICKLQKKGQGAPARESVRLRRSTSLAAQAAPPPRLSRLGRCLSPPPQSCWSFRARWRTKRCAEDGFRAPPEQTTSWAPAVVRRLSVLDISHWKGVDWVLNGWCDTVVEQPIDAETQKAMMAFYHKKQEEMKVRAHPAARVARFCNKDITSTVSVRAVVLA